MDALVCCIPAYNGWGMEEDVILLHRNVAFATTKRRCTRLDFLVDYI